MTELVLHGRPRERGRAHGESLRHLVHETVQRWRADQVARGLDPDERVDQLATRSGYRQTVATRTPELLQEMIGIAEGAALPFAQVFALNLLDEEWWYPGQGLAGCSVVGGLLDESDRHPQLAQNMDLPEWMHGLQILLRIRGSAEEPADEMILLTVAGMIGLAGMRRGGVAICVNTLLSLPRSSSGLPVACVVRAALEHPDAEAAAGFVAALPHASGQHYALADAIQVLGVEASGAGSALRRFGREEVLVHTNHPLWTHPTLVAESAAVTPVRLHSSHRRLAALEAYRDRSEQRGPVETLLGDHASGVRMVASAEFPTRTFGSVSFTPGTGRARVWLATEDTWTDIDEGSSR